MPASQVQPTIEAELRTGAAEQESLLVEIYRRANPAVVSIDASGPLSFALPEGHPGTDPDAPIVLSRGSGFLYDGQGYIITNNHVVEQADTMQVTFYDGSTTTAEVVGTDPASDLAVIQVDQLPPGATPLPLGNSGEVAVGQMAIAIGSPFGLQNTLTVGVISGLGRSLRGPSNSMGTFSIPNIIQSDTAINPGSSGGPLLNARGEVIGVNTAISTRRPQEGFAGVGYAVPSRVVQRVVPVLIREGSYDHPWVGIRMQTVDTLMSEEYDLAARDGVLITEVIDDSPAGRAGLQGGSEMVEYHGFPMQLGGDIITAINGQSIRSTEDLMSYLQLDASVGDTLTLTIIRDGQEQQVPLTLSARP
jgi:2-alkenal reductase